MVQPPDKSTKKPSIIKSLALSGKALSKEVIINYLARVLEKIAQLIKDNIPTIAAVLVSSLATVYITVLKFADKSFTFTGGQICGSGLIVALFLIAILNAPKIRKFYLDKRGKHINVFGLNWRMGKNSLIGPYCPHCVKSIISEDTLIESIEQTINEMFGEETIYTYTCLECHKPVALNVPLGLMKEEARKKILGEKPDK